MRKKEIILIYAITMFIMLFGLDIIARIKFGEELSFGKIFHPLVLSQFIYALSTLLLCRLILRKFFNPGKFLHLAWTLPLALAFFIILRYLLEEILGPVLFGFSNYPRTVSFQYYFLDNVYYALVYITLGFLLFLVEHIFEVRKNERLLDQKSREAELQFLRSQVNPHFLFNTLNNIYSLVYEKSEKAPGAVLQLSELMRYMLYEKKELVPLSREWEYIEHFISLQRLRYSEGMQGKIFTTIKNPDQPIAAFLLIPFVENVFKHADSKTDSLSWEISLKADDDSLLLETRNLIGHHQKDQVGGVGLENVKRRLELIYPGRHEVELRNDGERFYSRLLIKFNA